MGKPAFHGVHRAKTTGKRDLDTANSVVKQTLEIIRYFAPKAWVLESPQTGLLKKQPVMEGLGFQDVDYCVYGCAYRKRTRLWGNVAWEPRRLCRGDCGKVLNGRHLQTAQKVGDKSLGQGHHASWELYRVPSRLVDDIVRGVIRQVTPESAPAPH